MYSADMNTQQNIKTFIENLKNEIIAIAIEIARNENTTISAIEENTTINKNTAIVL